MQLDGKTALVTGTASGIGLSTAKALIGEGVKVFGVDVQAQEADALGALFTPMQMDLASPSAPEEILAQCNAQVGSPDVLLNIAGIGDPQPLTEMSPERYREYLEIDLIAPAMLTREYILNRGDKGGTIVNTASVLALNGAIRGAGYSEAKGGISAMTRQIAVEYGHRGFRINTIAPGFVETPATAERLANNSWFRETLVDRCPLRRQGAAEEIANVYLFLASPMSSFVHGQTITVDGGLGMTLYPPPPD